MALKACRECGHKVSTRAKACPGCGTPNPAKSSLSEPIGCGQGCALLLLIAVGGAVLASLFDDATSGARPSAPVAAACQTVSRDLVDRIASGLEVAGGGTIGRAAAVRSGAHQNAYFVAAEIRGAGLSGAVGVWASNRLDGTGFLFSVNNVANEFSAWGDGRTTDAAFSMSDPGAFEARGCLQ